MKVTDNDFKILAFLKANGKKTRTFQITEATGLDTTSCQYALKRLVENKLIIAEKLGGVGNPLLYYLTETGTVIAQIA